MSQASFKNKLIRTMSAEDFARLRPDFERVETTARQLLLRRDDIIDYIYFPESGLASVLVKADSSEPIEVGTIGFEGMTDFALSGRAAGETIVQVGGEAIRIRRTIFLEAVEESLPLALLMLRWHQALLAQVSYTALSHGGFTLIERLARLVLMLDDRTVGHVLPLVHDHFAWMLSVRRAGVSDGMQRLSAQGAIETRRGQVIILDRDMLIQLARGSYGPAEKEYERIMGHTCGPARLAVAGPIGAFSSSRDAV